MSAHPVTVVGYDGSPVSRSALRWALDHGPAGQRTVVVNTVGQEDSLLSLPALPGQEERARAMLEALWMEDESVLDAEVELIVDSEPPAASLARVAGERGASLIVVGHQERSGLDGMLHVSVAGRLLEMAPCPVLVVR